MSYKDFAKEIETIEGFMGSVRQREYMFELAKISTCAAEIGSWKGFSTAIVGCGMLEGKTGGKYYCIDTFEASNSGLIHENTFEVFNQAVKQLNLEDIIIPVTGYSYDPKVWQQIPNNLDFLYIDGDHETTSVLQDTILYVTKVKKDGFILYHDHTWETIQNAINQALELKLIKFIEYFDDFGIYVPNRT